MNCSNKVNEANRGLHQPGVSAQDRVPLTCECGEVASVQLTNCSCSKTLNRKVIEQIVRLGLIRSVIYKFGMAFRDSNK